MSTQLGDDVVVVSPHLDDAVFSLAPLLRAHVRSGGRVRVVTPLAGDPGSRRAAGTWDRQCGFAQEGQAARHRRTEDRRACRVLGAEPVHLDGVDEQYPSWETDRLWESLAPQLNGGHDLLLPGWPLRHPDHLAVAHLVLSRLDARRPVHRYVELPYARWARSTPPGWPRVPVAGRDAAAGLLACSRYRSQLAPLSRPPAARARLLVALAREQRAGVRVAPPVEAAVALAELPR